MTKELKIGFFGAGKMGGAILESLVRAKMVLGKNIFVCDKSAERLDELKKKFKIKSAKVEEILENSDVVFLATKPQDLDALLESFPQEINKKLLFISIAAGKKIASLEKFLPNSKIVRAMPNLAVSVGEGMTGFSLGSKANSVDARLANKLLNCTGKAVMLDESMLDAVTALSGSGPAFFAYMLQAMIKGGEANGLDAETSATLALQTMLGTSIVLSQGSISVEDFIKAVTSAKGTTAAGLDVLEKSSFNTIVKRTLSAATKRSKELGK